MARTAFKELLVQLGELHESLKDGVGIGVLVTSLVKAILNAILQVLGKLQVFMLQSQRHPHELIETVLFQEVLVKLLLLILLEEQEEDSCQMVRVLIGESVVRFPVKASLVALD